MASVAADPSAIAAALPLPSRSDAASPAGPSSAFADMLDAAGATAPHPQSGSAARTDDGSNPAQSGVVLTSGKGSSEPSVSGAAAADSGPGKNGGADNANGPAALDAGAAPLDVTLVAGLLLPPVPAAASPGADPTPAAAQDPQAAAGDASPAIGGDTGGKPGNRKDASASSDPVAVPVLAAAPILIPISLAGAVAASVSDSTPRVASSPVTALQSGPMFSAPGMGAPPARADAASSGGPAQQTDSTAQPATIQPADAQDVLPTVPSLASALPTDALQTAASAAASSAGTSDQSERAASAPQPVAMPATPSAPSTPLVALTPFTPTPPRPLSVENHVTDPSAGTAESTSGAEGAPAPLPAQVVVRFAPSVQADDNTSDNGANLPLGYAGHNVGATATTNSGPAGSAIPASFNSGLSMVQAAAAHPVGPSHAAAIPDAVPLAGIPVAIVARAEAGEKKFEIRLDPPDLGRIEVQLSVDSSGRATSHLIVDRPDTLDLLRRDAPALDRALQSAGLTTGDGALQFSLRDQSFAGRDQAAPTVPPVVASPPADGDPAPIDSALRRYGPPMGLGGGIDIRV